MIEKQLGMETCWPIQLSAMLSQMILYLISPHRYTFMRIATHAFRAFAGIFPQKDKQSLTFEGC
jgi:hypothetical protein